MAPRIHLCRCFVASFLPSYHRSSLTTATTCSDQEQGAALSGIENDQSRGCRIMDATVGEAVYDYQHSGLN